MPGQAEENHKTLTAGLWAQIWA